MTGWRVGWVVVPDVLVDIVERLQQNVYICAPHVSQVAALAALDAHDELDGHVERYRANRSLLIGGLAAAGITDIAPADGAFYVYAHVPHLTTGIGIDSLGLGRRWLHELGVAATAGVDFDLAARPRVHALLVRRPRRRHRSRRANSSRRGNRDGADVPRRTRRTVRSPGCGSSTCRPCSPGRTAPATSPTSAPTSSRSSGPAATACATWPGCDPRDGVGLWWKLVNRNKRTIVLDVKHDADREVLLGAARRGGRVRRELASGHARAARARARRAARTQRLARDHPGLGVRAGRSVRLATRLRHDRRGDVGPRRRSAASPTANRCCPRSRSPTRSPAWPPRSPRWSRCTRASDRWSTSTCSRRCSS